jgi:hypothetical protein
MFTRRNPGAKVRSAMAAGALVVTCVLQLAVLPAAQAAGEEWKPELIAPKTGARGQTDPVLIGLPDLPTAVLERLTLELDSIDVTAFVSRDGPNAVFTPPQPLAYGAHQLRLVEFAADGSVVERAAWTIEIRKSASFREGEASIASTVNASARIAERDLSENAPGKWQGNGAAQLQGAAADGDWRARGNADFLYNGQPALMPRQEGHFDVGRFLVKGESGPVTAAVGHQSVAPDSLVMQGFNRRGVSVGLGRETDAAAATAFSLSGQDVIGFQHGLATSDSKNRVDGVSVIGRPIPGQRDALALGATYVSGEGPTQTGAPGTGIGSSAVSSPVTAGTPPPTTPVTTGTPLVTAGSAAGVVADSQTIERRLRLRGEYAVSRFDSDGVDTGVGPEKDKAYSVLASYSPWRGKTTGDTPFSVQFGIEYKSIGTFFQSPSSPAGSNDRKGTRGFVVFDWGGLNLSGSLEKLRDNVNDVASLPQTRWNQSAFSLTYRPTLSLAPAMVPGQAPALPWYGQPMFNLGFINFDQDVVKASTALATGPFRATRSVTGAASFTYPRWMWSLAHTVGKIDDFTDTTDDTLSHLTVLNASLRFGEKLTVGPLLQINRIEDRTDNAKDSKTLTGVINVNYAFTPRLNANLSLAENRQLVDDASLDTRSVDTVGSVNWIVATVSGARPGLTLTLEGAHHNVDDKVNPANTRDSYELFVKAGISWLPRF